MAAGCRANKAPLKCFIWPKILIQWSINRPRRVVGHVVQVTMIIITWIEYMSFHVAKFYGYCNYMDHSAGCLTVPILKTSIPLFSSSFLPSSLLSQLRIPWSKASDRSLFYCYILLFIYVENGSKKKVLMHLNFALDGHKRKSKKPEKGFWNVVPNSKLFAYKLYLDL